MKTTNRVWLMVGGLLSAALAHAQAPIGEVQLTRLPVIDMHLHAAPLDAGPRTAACAPFDPPAPRWDQRRPYAEAWVEMLQSPACEDPPRHPKNPAGQDSGTSPLPEKADLPMCD